MAQREDVTCTSFMTTGGIVIVLNFPPDSLWEKKHSCFPSEGNEGFFNGTLNSLLKLVPGLNHFSPCSIIIHDFSLQAACGPSME